MDTEQLIETLAANGHRVCPAKAMSTCLLLWLSMALPGSAIVVMMMGLRPDFVAKLTDPQFLIQEGAALATTITAASAALCASIPGQPRWKLTLPVIPLAVSMASLGRQCQWEWLTYGWGGMEYRADLACIPAIALAAAVPAISLLVLLRQGAVLSPVPTLGLAVLAAAALGDAALRLFHPVDAALMVIVWQLGTVLAFTFLGGLAGQYFPRLLRRHA